MSIERKIMICNWKEIHDSTIDHIYINDQFIDEGIDLKWNEINVDITGNICKKEQHIKII